jgi:hypothetical protein
VSGELVVGLDVAMAALAGKCGGVATLASSASASSARSGPEEMEASIFGAAAVFSFEF